MTEEAPDENEHPIIFNFRSYREFLKEMMRFHKRAKTLSARLLAKKSGFKNSNYIKLLLDGKRNLTLESAQKLGRGLELNQRENTYLENLVLLEMLKHHPIRLEIERQISNLSLEDDMRIMTGEQTLPLQNPRLGIIFEALAIPTISLAEIQNQLGISAEELANDLRVLQSFRLVRRKPDGTYVRVERIVEISKPEKNSEALPFSKKLIIALPENQVGELTALIFDFLRELNRKYSHLTEAPDCVCKIDLSLHSVLSKAKEVLPK